MNKIRAISFVGARSGKYSDEKAKESLRLMAKSTACNTVVFVLGALQDTPQSEHVDYQHLYMPTDNELGDMIQYARYLGLNVFLEPLVNCKDGTWRAFINFFDRDIVCEPKWCNWFESYTEYQLHYAEIAEERKCEMLIIGSEMVQSEHREEEWRKLISRVREVYSGTVIYSADKYNEENVAWWDAVDMICSSAYYPKGSWENEMDRIKLLCDKYDRPYFIGEIGCKSCNGASKRPNQWAFQAPLDLNEQAEYFKEVLNTLKTREYITGLNIWEWNYRIPEDADKDKGYGIAGKPVCDILHRYWSEET